MKVYEIVIDEHLQRKANVLIEAESHGEAIDIAMSNDVIYDDWQIIAVRRSVSDIKEGHQHVDAAV